MKQLVPREWLSFVVKNLRLVMSCKSWGVLTQEDWEFKKKAGKMNFILFSTDTLLVPLRCFNCSLFAI